MNAFKVLPHSWKERPASGYDARGMNPNARTRGRQMRRARRRRLARTAAAFAVELARKPPVTAVRAWLKRWWIWAASRIGAEPQPPRESCWRMRDPRFWAAARRQATGR